MRRWHSNTFAEGDKLHLQLGKHQEQPGAGAFGRTSRSVVHPAVRGTTRECIRLQGLGSECLVSERLIPASRASWDGGNRCSCKSLYNTLFCGRTVYIYIIIACSRFRFRLQLKP